MIDCDFYYFKPSGKWKYHGEGRFPRPLGDGWHEVNRAEIARENSGMPGIVGTASGMIVVVIPRDNCDVRSAWPRILRPEIDK